MQQFQGDRFINGMSLALCLFCLLFPTVLGDDMARRGFKQFPTVLGNSAGAAAWSACLSLLASFFAGNQCINSWEDRLS